MSRNERIDEAVREMNRRRHCQACGHFHSLTETHADQRKETK